MIYIIVGIQQEEDRRTQAVVDELDGRAQTTCWVEPAGGWLSVCFVGLVICLWLLSYALTHVHHLWQTQHGDDVGNSSIL